jgi:hypothetical protein
MFRQVFSRSNSPAFVNPCKQIFESSKNPTDIGSISIQINAFRVLKHLGASIENLGGVEFGGVCSTLFCVSFCQYHELPSQLIGFDSESTNGDTQRWLVPEAKEDPVGFFMIHLWVATVELF